MGQRLTQAPGMQVNVSVLDHKCWKMPPDNGSSASKSCPSHQIHDSRAMQIKFLRGKDEGEPPAPYSLNPLAKGRNPHKKSRADEALKSQ
jgi:hypothetical protein